MKKIIRLVATSILLLTSYAIFAQNVSNKGKEFWVGYGHHQYMTFPTDNSQNMTIYLSAEEAATVTIEIDSSGLLPSQWWRRTYNIPANTVIDIANPATPAATFTTAALAWGPIPKGPINSLSDVTNYPDATKRSNTSANYDARLVNDPPPAGNGGEGFFRKKGIHITSNVPIVAYAHIYGGVSSGATMLLPIESWGYAYTSINSNQGDAPNSYNWVYVIARLNNTVIEITPSQTSQLGKPAGVPFQVTLNKGQIYQLQGQATPAGDGVNLTGTTVKVVANSSGVCNPIAVFSGSSRTINTACSGGGGRDNDMQQGFPQQTWGKRYLLAPLSQATSSTNIQANSFQTNPYRVVVRDPTTVVRRNGTIMTGLQANSFYYFESSQPELIEADKPFMVAQFMSGGCLNGLGDPEMIYVSPIEQGVKKTGFYRNTKEAINVNYVTIVVPTAGVPSLRIDNSTAFNHQYVHPRDTRYTVVIKGWAASQAQSIISCDSAFTAVTYGLGGFESYGYNAGTYLNNLNAVSDFYNSADTSRNTVKNHAFGFVNAPMEIGALIRYKPLSIRWKLSTLSSVLSPSADVFQNNPTPVDSVSVGGGWSYRYRLPGTYTFNTAGTYYIPIQLTSDVYGAGDCRNIEDISIEYIIKPFPTANFTFTVGACSSDSVAFTGPTVTAEGYKVLKWKWTFSSAPGDTSILQNPKAKLNTGNNSVKLDLVVEIGGLASVTKIVTVPGLVNVKFGASATNICIGQTVTFSDTTAGATINNWYWDFGDGKPGSVLNANSNVNQSYTYTTAGNFIAKHTVSITGGGSCIIDTIKIPITVSPKAYVDFTASSGCLPANGLANFTATSPTTGVSSFTWTFGDPASGAANTAIGSTASHNYNADGTYAVKLAVVTTSGCVGDTTKNLVFNRLPQITGTIGVVSVLCDNTPPVAISAPTIANGVSGTANWRSFKGGVVDPSMSNYNPAIAGYGSDTIYFKFTTVNSCTDSAKYPITVAARPRGNFTYVPASTTCISPTTPVNFTSNITVPNSSVLSYSWFFESPSVDPAKRSNLANPTYNYPEGTFLTMLSLTGANGCMFDTLQNIVVSKAPAISALTQGDICDNVAPFTIAAPSIGGGVTGTGVFKSFKNAITSNGLYSPLLAGVGVDTIYYVFTTSTGCVDSVKKHFTVLGTPRGNFSFSPSNGCLPTTGLVSFTNNIVVPGSSVANYLWQFESPLNTPSTTSSLSNPTYNYNEGPFTIKLSITGANGCLYDTSQNVIFGKKPAINPLVQASICENNGAITIATPAVTNSVGGSGVFRSFKNAFTNVLSGGYDPSIASYGVDTIYYRFTTTNNCTDSVKLPLQINARPRGIFTFSPSGCLDASGIVNFSNNISVVGSTISNYNWKFESPSNAPANISSASNPSHVYNVGTFKIDLNTVASNGCSFDTTQTVTFGKKPSIAPLIVSNICESVAPFNFTAPNILNSVSGVGVFSSFKGASNAAGLYNPSIAGYGVDTVYYKFTTGVDCFDSVKAPITIQARPRATFTISPTGCLNASGTASFTSNAFVPNSSVSTYAWQFESPLNTVATTSNLPNPTYNYNTDGTYTIKLTVTGGNNCSFDTSVTRLFSKQPSIAALSVPVGVCENEGTKNISEPNITNGASGVGVFRSFKNAITSTGVFSPSVAGFGVDTIYYVFTTGGGCKDSVKAPITIQARPRATFTISPTGCLNASGTASFTSNAFVPNSSVSTYAWQFESPLNTVATTSNLPNPTYNYNTDGTYTIKLTVTGANNCSFDTSVTRLFSKQPSIAALSVPVGVCENEGTKNISEPNITNGASGVGVFRSFKNAITTAGVFSPSVAGFGVDTIYYVFTTGGGCKDSVKAPITIQARPRATFTISPTGCLNASGTASFTSNSFVPNSSVSTYAWQFESPLNTVATTSNLPNPTYNYNTDGTYTIKLTVTGANNCSFDTSVTRLFSKQPSIAALSVPVGVCENEGTKNISEPNITNGASGVGVFRSFKNAITSAGVFSPSVAGFGVDTIYYVFNTGGGCKDSVKAPITIQARPRATFTISPTGCLNASGTASFTSNAFVPNSSVSTYAWQFESPLNTVATTSNLPNPTYNYNTDGTYTIKLTVTGANNCSFDTSVTRLFSKQPSIAALSVPVGVCENEGTKNISEPNITNGASGVGVFRSFKNAITSTGVFSPSVAGFGVDTIYYVFTTGGGCKDSVKAPITIQARPRATFTISPTGCLNASGTASFTSNAFVPNSSVSTYAWQFESPLNTVATTSNLPNPTYNYNTDGTYTIKLTVTGANNCSFDTSVTRLFSKTPQIAPFSITGRCENADTFRVSAPSILNGATGVGVFSSFKNAFLNTSTGLYNPALAGSGVDTVYYTFTTGSGCSSTVKTPFSLSAKPISTITIIPNLCLDSTLTVSSSSSVSGSTITTWNWNLDNGSTPVLNNGNPFTVNYTSLGVKNLTLITESTNGCKSDTAKATLTVRPMPVSNFTVPLSVCMPNGVVNFTNTSSVTPSGSLTYVWDFGDAAGSSPSNPNNSTLVNGSHIYPSITNYTVSLTATSLYGCQKTETKSINPFVLKPNAYAKTLQDTLCQGNPSFFIDSSWSVGSSITGWRWIMGDGSPVRTTQNPIHTYTNPGNYKVSLIVTNAAGCVSDTFPKNVLVYLQPIIDAGPSFVIQQGDGVRFNPTANDSTTTRFLWTPPIFLSKADTLRPYYQSAAGSPSSTTTSTTYRLTATGLGRCTASDTLTVKVLGTLVIPNAFSPNNDGINDVWDIPNLRDYPGSTVQIFNRSGQLVFTSNGYNKPWDGKYLGAPLPIGTYYYIIDPRNGIKTLSGSITILR